MSNYPALTPTDSSLVAEGTLASGVFQPQYSRRDDFDYFGLGPWQRGDQLTISFAPDGTQILNQQSRLYESFGWMLHEKELEKTVVRAFQVWARTTNLNVGQVEDGGQPFGSLGLQQHDLRFGDIRVGAIDMAPDVFAVAVPVDNLASGTWSGEVIFNSSAEFSGLRQFFQVALHEAGHILGLEHSNDPSSPMFAGGDSIRITSDDIVALRDLYGFRRLDFNEEEGETNNLARDATSIDFPDDHENGELPLVAFGDLGAQDVDFYKVDVPSDYEGRLSFLLKTSKLSSVSPDLAVFDRQGQLVRRIHAGDDFGVDLVTSIPDVSGGQKFFIRVSGRSSVFSMGSYALGMVFHETTTMGWPKVQEIIDTGLYNREEPEDFWESLLDSDAPLNDDKSTNDTFETATTLTSPEGFREQSYYDVQGSLASINDSDFYEIRSSDLGVNGLTNMNIRVDSVGVNGLIPDVEVFDADRNALRSAVLINSNGQLSIQTRLIEEDRRYFVKISSLDSSEFFATGNYRLTIGFDNEALRLRRFAAGALTWQDDLQEHTLHVAQSQILHINLLAGYQPSAPNAVVWLTIYDEEGMVKFRSATRPGETRSANSVLFSPGSYSVRVELALPDGVFSESAFSYLVRGRQISDPQGPKLLDPTDSPFPRCRSGLPEYCYPNDHKSAQPYIFVEESLENVDPPKTPWVDTNQWYWYTDWLTPEVPPNL